MYWVTRTPKRLAGTRWPTSCSAIETATPTTTARTPSTYSRTVIPAPLRGRPSAGRRQRRASRPSVAAARSRAHASAAITSSTSRGAGRPASWACVEDIGHGVDDLEEAEVPVEERGDADLVGRVEHRGHHAARLAGPPGQGERREGHLVDRLERPGRRLGPRAAGGGVGHPVRPGEAERDGQAHVGRAHLGQGRAVDELDHRVHDRLRVDDDVDPVEADAEQQVRLDDLEPLVDQRRGVRRDQRAHRPGRVGERLLGADVGERGAVAAAERPAGGGEDQPAHLLGPPAAQALGERGVLGVDRDDLVRAGQRRSPAARR